MPALLLIVAIVYINNYNTIIYIWVSFRENEKWHIYGIVSAKRDLVHIIKFVIKMPYV